MRLALAQMSMVNDMERNFKKTLQFLDLADSHKADLVFYPKLCFTPYFPQYKKREVGGVLNHIPSEFSISPSDTKIIAMSNRAAEYGFYVSPNFYAKGDGEYYCMSAWIDIHGNVRTQSTAIHIPQDTAHFEEDYFTPSEDGYFVYDTTFGRVGIVSGYDRHFPESIRACALKGAELVIIPAANTKSEELTMFEWELRVAAYENGIFVAMANRVGREGDMEFAGESIVIHPDGHVVVKADDSQQFIICNVNLEEAKEQQTRRPYLARRRPRMYGL